MTSDKKNSAHTQEIKARLKVLKAKGLYSGDLRRAKPTRYATKLANDFADVAAGRAQVVKIAHSKTSKNSGSKAAKAKARELAASFSTTMRAKGDRVIVRVANRGERAVYSAKEDTIVTRYQDTAGRTVTHEYIKPSNERLPALNDNERYALPFSRGKDGISYIERATEAEILALANEYETKKNNPYRDATSHIQIAYIGTTRAKPKAPSKPKQKRKSRAKPKPSAEIVNLATERAKRSKK